MHVAIWRQNGFWYLSASQNNQTVLSPAMSDSALVYGILSIKIKGDGIQFCLRDFIVSNGIVLR